MSLRQPIRLALVATALAIGLRGGVLAPRALADDPPTPGPEPAPAMEGGPIPGDGSDGGLDDDTADGLDPEQVKKAIDRGVTWLKGRQYGDGTWGKIGGPRAYDPKYKGRLYDYPAGTAALGVYTLLKCGVSVDDAVVKKGLAFLKAKYLVPETSYEISMALLAVTATADPFKRMRASVAAGDRVKLTGEFRKWAQTLQTALLKKRTLKGWRYNNGPPDVGGDQDTSSTQLACLALFTADRCGILAPSTVWSDVLQFQAAQQEVDGPEWPRAVVDQPAAPVRAPGAPSAPGGDAQGRYAPPGAPAGEPPKDRARGFCYINDPTLEADEAKPIGSMTACGVGSTLMARFLLRKRDDKTWAKQDAKAIQQSIYDGCAWVDENWSAVSNPPSTINAGYGLYYMYCVERAMDLTGCTRIGKHEWYVEMGQNLLGRQKPQGYWSTESTHTPYDVLDTCFALLFLKRATRGGIPYPSVTAGSDDPPTDGRGDDGGK